MRAVTNRQQDKMMVDASGKPSDQDDLSRIAEMQPFVLLLRPQVSEGMSNVISGYADPPSDKERKRILNSIADKLIPAVAGRLPGRDGPQLLKKAIMNDFSGFGLLQPLLDDDTVSEIMVNGKDSVFVERKGMLHPVPEIKFRDDGEIRRIIDRIVTPLNKLCDETTPYVDARLPDGSRVNAIIPPLAIDGPSLTIRKFSSKKLTGQDLLNVGTASPAMLNFMWAAVRGRCNVLISGGTGSGKTTLLNILSNYIPANERIVTIEDTAELKLDHQNIARLEARSSNSEGKGAVTIHDLVVNSLRMRPDRIIVGECRSDEAIEMLQAMNTGHDGSLTTVHANDVRASFTRLETMVLGGSASMPAVAIKQTIASALDIVVQTSRMCDGSRKIVEIAALDGMEGDTITATPLFKFEQSGVRNRKVTGAFVGCGHQPPEYILKKMESSGVECQQEWFTSTLEV